MANPSLAEILMYNGIHFVFDEHKWNDILYHDAEIDVRVDTVLPHLKKDLPRVPL